MTRALDAILARLEAAGCGVQGVSLFAGPDVDMSSAATAILSVAETGGRAAIGTQQEPSALRQPWFQIAARADRYEDAAALADRAYAALSVTNLAIEDVFFLTIRAVQEPAGLGATDASGRPIVSFNVSTLARIPGLDLGLDGGVPGELGIDGGAPDSVFTGAFDGGGV